MALPIANLEEIRLQKGEKECIEIFRKTVKQNRFRAVQLINTPQMTYPCLFILIPSIREHRLQQQIWTKYAVAMEITRQILEEEYQPKKDYLKGRGDLSHQALLWMITTSYQEEYPGEAFQKVQDIVISVLIQLHHDNTVLEKTARLIFERRKRGQNVHELIWAYFKSNDPQALKWIAEQLPKADSSEAEFICDLLGIEHTDKIDTQNEYQKYMSWWENHKNNLTFSDENKQYTSRPIVCSMTQGREERAL